jgi:hypothetical protein
MVMISAGLRTKNQYADESQQQCCCHTVNQSVSQSVGIATNCWLGGGGSSPDRGKRFFRSERY